MKERAAAVVVALTTAAALAVLCVRGFYVRWFSDDFALPACVVNYGFWGGQATWYRTWSGRFTFNFAEASLAEIGPLTAAVVVLIATAAMVAALRPRLHLPLALAIAYVILLGASDVPQSILWETGVLSYTLPLAAFAWWIGSAAARTEWRWFDAVVPLVAGGCSETQVLAQIVICAIAFAAWRRKPMLAGLTGSLICLAVIAIAPGNAIRRMKSPPTAPIVDVIKGTILDAASFFTGAITRSGLMLLLVFVASLLWAPRLSRRVFIVAVLCTIACAGVTLAAGEITLVAALPERARMMSHALIVVSVAAFGATLRRPERWRPAFVIGVTILSILPLISAVQLAREIPEARDFAQRWDRFDDFLRRNPARNVFVYDAPGSIGTLRFLDHDPTHNIAISMVYRLQSIAAMPVQRNGRMVIGPLPKDAVRYRFE
jgi:hypothetical protein